MTEDAPEPEETSLGGFDEAAANARAHALVGQVIADRYRLHNVLAMGGMGAVFTGEHVHMRKRVAIKVLHPDMEGLPGLVARFEREAIVGAHVEHKNIASARDFGRMADGSYYLVLEFVSGLTLRQLMHQGPLPVGRALHIAKQMATGLAKVHAKGITHRDVNPRNVMVVAGSKDLVKLIDFGFAKVPVERFNAVTSAQGLVVPSRITGDGVIFGTIGYLAPEAANGMNEVDARSDLYALGAILYEMLSGMPPFGADSPAEHYHQHRFNPVPPMAERSPAVTVLPEHERIAARLLSKLPHERYQSADELAKVLDKEISRMSPEAKSAAKAQVPDDLGNQMTIAGADSLRSLPRFEDVADKPLLVPSTRPGPPAKARRPAPKQSEPAGWGLWVVLFLALAGGGVYAAAHYGYLGPKPVGSAAPSTAPTTTASASAAVAPRAAVPSSIPSAAPVITQVDGFDADVWKKAVWQAPSSKDYSHAIQGIYALAKLDPKSFSGVEMKTAAVDIVANSAPDQTGKLVSTLAESFGTDGLDVLYDLLTTRGGADGAKLATELFQHAEVRARATTALRIAIELRQAPCNEKLGLLDRAVKEGDARSLGILVAIRSPQCDINTGACCMPGKPELERAVIDLTNRVERH